MAVPAVAALAAAAQCEPWLLTQARQPCRIEQPAGGSAPQRRPREAAIVHSAAAAAVVAGHPGPPVCLVCCPCPVPGATETWRALRCCSPCHLQVLPSRPHPSGDSQCPAPAAPCLSAPLQPRQRPCRRRCPRRRRRELQQPQRAQTASPIRLPSRHAPATRCPAVPPSAGPHLEVGWAAAAAVSPGRVTSADGGCCLPMAAPPILSATPAAPVTAAAAAAGVAAAAGAAAGAGAKRDAAASAMVLEMPTGSLPGSADGHHRRLPHAVRRLE